jgi:hypothetical protein
VFIRGQAAREHSYKFKLISVGASLLATFNNFVSILKYFACRQAPTKPPNPVGATSVANILALSSRPKPFLQIQTHYCKSEPARDNQ